MGQPDLKLDPPLRILVFRNRKELDAACRADLFEGRDHLMACTVAEGQLPSTLLRDLTRRLLTANFSRLPAPFEAAVISFFSTIESSAVHVQWGIPPVPAERTFEWAMLHRLLTQPDFSGRAHIYLHNLAGGMDSDSAIRSMSEDPARINADVKQYLSAGRFAPAAAPNRPINPDRDLNTTSLTTDEGQLMHADMLTPASVAIYESLLRAGKQIAAADEGLGLLALRSGDKAAAAKYFEASRSAGNHNPAMLTVWAGTIPDNDKAIAILKEALTENRDYAPAHWALGERIPDEPRRFAEWKQAVALAPRNLDWWDRYAQLSMKLEQYAEAGRAWSAAAQASPDSATREKYLALRASVETKRLDDIEEQRRKEAAAKAEEIARLKAAAKEEIRQLEAKANTKGAPAGNVVDWFDTDSDSTFSGTLTQIQCAQGTYRIEIRDNKGARKTFLVRDPGRIETRGGEMQFTCGPQKPRQLMVRFQPLKNSGAIAGEITGIEFPQ